MWNLRNLEEKLYFNREQEERNELTKLNNLSAIETITKTILYTTKIRRVQGVLFE